MMIRKITVLILIIVGYLNLYSQVQRQYEPFEFEDFDPVWSHVVIDSSIIGTFKGTDIWTDDTLYYDGFSHFHSTKYYEVDPVFVDDKMIVVEMNGGYSACEGAFIQCLDINTGEVLWESAYDLRTEDRKEYPQRAYINAAGQLEILGFRKNNSATSDFPKPFWYEALMSVRKYNLGTGELEERIKIPEDDTLALHIYNPNTIFFIRKVTGYLYPYGENYQYVKQYKVYYNYILDNKSHVLDSNVVEIPYDLYLVDVNMIKTQSDNFVNLRYVSSKHYFTGPVDTFKLVYTLYDRDFNLKKTYRFDDKIKYNEDYWLSYADDDIFVVSGGKDITYVEDTVYLEVTISTFDNNANLTEQFTLQNEGGLSYFYGPSYSKILRLKNESGLLVFTSREKDDGYNYLVIFKSDGNGNVERLKELKVIGKNHAFYIVDVYYTPSGDILLKGLDTNTDLEQDGYASFGTVYTLLTPESIGLKTGVIDIAKCFNVTISPNPAKSSLTLDFDDVFTGDIKIFDALGRAVLDKTLQNATKQDIDISGLPRGIYFVKATDMHGQKEYKTTRFVKE